VSFDPIAFAKAHPIATGVGALVAVGAVLLLSGALSGSAASSAATTTSTDSDPLAAQESNQNFQLAALQLQGDQAQNLATQQYNLQMYQTQSGVSLQESELQINEALTKYTTDASAAAQTSGQDFQLASQTEADKASYDQLNLQTTSLYNLAALQTAGNEFALQTNADLQKSLASLNAQVTIHQTDAAAGVAKTQSNNGLFGSIIGLASAFI
jgi:hypothetical protein